MFYRDVFSGFDSKKCVVLSSYRELDDICRRGYVEGSFFLIFFYYYRCKNYFYLLILF